MKDRAALNMVLDGERSGKLNHSRIILDSTSGNTGIAYAMIGANRGYRVRLVLPGNASEERKRILKAYGAEMVFSDPGEGSDGAIRMVPQDLRGRSRPLFLPRPVQQPGQLEGALRDHRARDHRARPAGGITHFVAAMGTSGTFMGTSRRLKRDLPAREVLFGAALERIPRPGRPEAHAHRHRARLLRSSVWPTATSGLKPRTLTAWCAAWRAKKALLVGISSGCNVHAATLLARELAERGETATIVTMLCDSAEKYLSEHFWDEMNDPHRIRTLGGHGGARPRDLSQRMLRRHAGLDRRRRKRPCASRCVWKMPSQARRRRATNCAPKICWPPTRPRASGTWT